MNHLTTTLEAVFDTTKVFFDTTIVIHTVIHIKHLWSEESHICCIKYQDAHIYSFPWWTMMVQEGFNAQQIYKHFGCNNSVQCQITTQFVHCMK